ncbi:MAG: acetylxylan esterase [Clostridia bacterium]|nr:acetylxylan esterase [Clostridia bacterium]
MIKKLNGDACHDYLTGIMRGRLAFDENADYPAWKEQTGRKLRELLGLDAIARNICPLNIEIEENEDFGSYRRIRLTYESERRNIVPAYLLIPKQGKVRYPLAIVLQGHSTGFHNSVGIKKYEQDYEYQPDGCFGLQAVENGFAALCIEQRGMGEVRSPRYPGPGGVHQCSFTAMTAINLGRTVIGERVWDVSRGIDMIGQLGFPEIDSDRIMITGSSGGGTASFYAACCDERIKYAAPGCAFCSYRSSIMSILHCVCNNIPHASEWFEMEDLSCLIAPRKLTVLAGKLDDIFPIDGVEKSFETVKKIYNAGKSAGNCRLVLMPEGHHWCPDVAWEAINRDTAELGW